MAQSGKVTVVVVGNGNTSAVAKWKDTSVYQVSGHGDYVQETH